MVHAGCCTVVHLGDDLGSIAIEFDEPSGGPTSYPSFLETGMRKAKEYQDSRTSNCHYLATNAEW